MYCSRRLYKGDSYQICLPISDTGVTSVRFYTSGDMVIEKEGEIIDDIMCFELTKEELDLFPDGVLRYSYKDFDSNTKLVVVTPGDYSGTTLNDFLEDAFDSGYTSGYTDGLNACSGGSEDLIANLQGDYFIIPEGTTKIRDYAFYEAPFSSITIPSSVTSIGEYAFKSVPFSSITIPSSVTSIANFAFNNCSKLTEIVVPDTVNSLGSSVFYNCVQLTAATLPSGLTEIGANLFAFDSLTGITLPAGITSIGNYAFAGNKLTGNITIPSGVTHIYRSAFSDCSGLTSMTFKRPVPATITATSNYTASLGSSAYTWPIYVPCEAVEDYKTAWPYYAHRIMCNEPEQDYATDYFTLEVQSGNSTSSLTIPSIVSHYRKNGGEWIINGALTEITVQEGDIFEMKGQNTTIRAMFNYGGPPMPYRFKAYGNIMSLFYGDDFIGKTLFPNSDGGQLEGAFAYTTVSDAENLVIPVTDFSGSNTCTSMFNSCRCLITAPSILPATALTDDCYQYMFQACSSLTKAPELPATTLADGCYYSMFEDCTSLVKGPDLLAPVVPSAAYLNMFKGTHINSVKCLALDTSAKNCTKDMLSYVLSTGTFIKHPNATVTTGVTGEYTWYQTDETEAAEKPRIPVGWTVVDADI